MIDIFLNQTITLKTVTGYNEYAEPITSSKVINVRWEGGRRIVRDAKGQEVVSEARFFCTEKVSPGDIVEYDGKEWTVIAVSERTDLDGSIIFREVAC